MKKSCSYSHICQDAMISVILLRLRLPPCPLTIIPNPQHHTPGQSQSPLKSTPVQHLNLNHSSLIPRFGRTAASSVAFIVAFSLRESGPAATSTMVRRRGRRRIERMMAAVGFDYVR